MVPGFAAQACVCRLKGSEVLLYRTFGFRKALVFVSSPLHQDTGGASQVKMKYSWNFQFLVRFACAQPNLDSEIQTLTAATVESCIDSPETLSLLG